MARLSFVRKRIVCFHYDDRGRTVREITLGDEGVTRPAWAG